MARLTKDNAKEVRGNREPLGPSDDFRELEDPSFNKPSMAVGPAQAAVADTYTPIPADHPALPVDEVIPPGVTRAELRKNETYEPEPRRVPEDLSNPKRVDGLAKNYLAAAIDSLKRTPNAGLSMQFRSRLETFRVMVTECVRAGVKGEPAIVAAVLGALAVDGPGKIDGIVFLRQVMGQVLWSGSADVARLRRPKPDRDEQRQAPYGMENMSDHSDAIQGMVGPDTNPNREMTEDDVYAAVASVHGLLNAMADTLPDNVDEQAYLRLESGLNYLDERVPDETMPGGVRWEPVYDLDKAMDIQLVKNEESIKLKETRNAERRSNQLKALARMHSNL